MAKFTSRAAERLAALIASGQYTQRLIAERVGTTQPVVSRWVAGGRTPSGALIAAVERAFGIPVGDWFIPAAAESPVGENPATGTEG